MLYRSWENWKSSQYHVKKGEKSHKRNKKGVALFSQNQVELNIITASKQHSDWDDTIGMQEQQY